MEEIKTITSDCTSYEELANSINNYFMHNLGRPTIYDSFKMPDGAKTVMDSTGGNNSYIRAAYVCGNTVGASFIMPDIKEVNVIGENKVVVITFTDGTTEKAVTTGNDVFSFEQGISVCITKKLLSGKSGGNGGNLYNKIIDRAVKKYNKAQKDKQKAEEQKKAAEAKYQKTVVKKAAKRAKREAAAREAQIEIQKEAYLRAMQEFNNASEEQK